MAMNISKRIKEARAKLDLSQRKAAMQWGLSPRSLEKWEQGSSVPRGLYLKHMERILEKIEKSIASRIRR